MKIQLKDKTWMILDNETVYDAYKLKKVTGTHYVSKLINDTNQTTALNIYIKPEYLPTLIVTGLKALISIEDKISFAFPVNIYAIATDDWEIKLIVNGDQYFLFNSFNDPVPVIKIDKSAYAAKYGVIYTGENFGITTALDINDFVG